MPTAVTPPPRTQVNFCIDVAALEILQRYAPPGTHMKGRFLSRLLYEHAVRMEERQRFQDRRSDGLHDDDGPPA